MNDYLPLLLVLIVGLIILTLLRVIRRVTIYQYERGVLFEQGKWKKVLEPGDHWLFSPLQTVQRVDIRIRHITIPGQEVLTADNISLKVSLVLSFRVVDPVVAMTSVVSFLDGLYLEMQLILRDLIGQQSVDDLLASRQTMAGQLTEEGRTRAASLGVELLSAGVKDIMFPGELKTVFAQVVNARKAGLAALEKARGEQAALRNLANAAHLLENNPDLMRLRVLQALDSSSGNTIVLELGSTPPKPEPK